MYIPNDIFNTSTTIKEMAKLLKLTNGRIAQLAKDGIIVKNDDNQILVFPSLENFRKSREQSQDDIDYDREHARLEKIKADKEELRLKKLKNELYEAKVVESTMANIYVILRTQLLGIPNKVASQIPLECRSEVNELLTQYIEDALFEMAEYNPQMFVNEDDFDSD